MDPEHSANGRISKAVAVDAEDGGITTMLYKYDCDKIIEVNGKAEGIGIGVKYSYSDNKLTKQSFTALLVDGYNSFFYSDRLINKAEYYNSWEGKSNITFEYNNLKQIIKSTEIDEDKVTTVTTYKYDVQGNKISATENNHTVTYEYDDKINPASASYNAEVMMVLFGSVHNLTKEKDGSYIVTYVYTYDDSGKINTEKE